MACFHRSWLPSMDASGCRTAEFGEQSHPSGLPTPDQRAAPEESNFRCRSQPSGRRPRPLRETADLKLKTTPALFPPHRPIPPKRPRGKTGESMYNTPVNKALCLAELPAPLSPPLPISEIQQIAQWPSCSSQNVPGK